MSKQGFRTSLFGFCRTQVLDYIDKQGAEHQRVCDSLERQHEKALQSCEAKHRGEIAALEARMEDVQEQKRAADERCRLAEDRDAENRRRISELERALALSHDKNKELAGQNATLLEENGKLLSKLKDFILASDYPETEMNAGEIRKSPIYRYENTGLEKKTEPTADMLFDMVKSELERVLEAVAKRIGAVQRDEESMDWTGN